MTFGFAARAVAIVCAVLFVVFAVFPALYAPTYGVTADEGVQFMTRRAAPLFIGPAVILWIAATSPRSPLRDAVAAGVSLIFLGVAFTGVAAFVQGVAAPAILIAAALECLAAGVLWMARKN